MNCGALKFFGWCHCLAMNVMAIFRIWSWNSGTMEVYWWKATFIWSPLGSQVTRIKSLRPSLIPCFGRLLAINGWLCHILLNSKSHYLNTSSLIYVKFSYGLIDMRTTFRLPASARQLRQARAYGPHPFGHRWYLEWILESSQQRLLIKWKNQIMDRNILALIC